VPCSSILSQEEGAYILILWSAFPSVLALLPLRSLSLPDERSGGLQCRYGRGGAI
jgi:hypothetical protein